MAEFQTPNIQETFRRLCEIEEMGCAEIGLQVTAVPKFLFASEVSMYWTHRVGSVTTSSELGEEYQVWSVQVIARFVGYRTTEGLPNDAELIVNNVIFKMVDTFNSLEGLQSESYPETQDFLEWQQDASASGYTEFSDTGSGASAAVGTEFTLNLTFVTERIQRTTK